MTGGHASGRRPRFVPGRHAAAVLWAVAAAVALWLVGRFALPVFFSLSGRRDAPVEFFVDPPRRAPESPSSELRRRASFAGHSYVCAEDPDRPGTYAVVFSPALRGDGRLMYAAIRDAIRTAYGEDVSGVEPEVEPRGDALRVEFRLEGISYVALTARTLLAGELSAFSLHRSE